MLPALPQGSWNKGFVTSVFVLTDRMIFFGYLCTSVFALYFMSIVLGGVVYQPVVGWGRAPFTSFMVSSGGFPARGRFCN